MLRIDYGIPEETGISSANICNFINRLSQNGIPMHSLLLFHRDKLITEGYYAPYTANTLHRMFSISKSFTAIAIGLLVDEGRLSLSDKIVTFFPDKVPADVHPWISSMTIRDMLMMRTCHASTTYKLDMRSDWVESFFTVPPTHPSGKLFHYDTSSAHTLCALVERLTGMPMLHYLKEKLAPLGLSEASYMITDPFGVSMGGSGLVATPMDLLKFGYFISHKGNVDGQQLLSASYIEEATSDLTDTCLTAPLRSESCGYGYQFWRNERNGYVCYGMGGQLIIFLPDYDLICVTTADTQGIGGGNQYIYDALYEEILPFIQENPLPQDEKSHSELLKLLKNLQIAPLNGETASPTTASISGITWNVQENVMGFSQIRLNFSDSAGTLSFQLKGVTYSLDFGMGNLVTGTFPVYDMHCVTSGVWLRPDTLYVKAHIIDKYVGSVHFEFVFGNDDMTIFMKKQEESLFAEFNGHLYCTHKD